MPKFPFLCVVMTVNRRLDEWVKLEHLDLASVETVVDEKVEDKVSFCFEHFMLSLVVLEGIFPQMI